MTPQLLSHPRYQELHPLIMRLMHVTGADEEKASSWIGRWLEEHRFYHTIDHIFQLREDLGKDWDRDDVFLTVIFHDIIYDPRRKDNEERSKELFMSEIPSEFLFANMSMVTMVAGAIMETKHDVPPTSELGQLVCAADLGILDGSLTELVDYEIKLSKEYQFAPHEAYRIGRADFLQGFTDRNPCIKELIDFVKHRRMNIGIYAGSFDPFTIGHLNILRKAERIFDKVVIARGLNPAKKMWEYALPPCLDFHERAYVGNFKWNNEQDKGVGLVERPTISDEMREPHMAALLLKHKGATLIRGLRGASDLEAEKVQQVYVQQMMKDVPMNVVHITCDREFEHISSSAFKQVIKVDRDLAAQCCPDGLPSAW